MNRDTHTHGPVQTRTDPQRGVSGDSFCSALIIINFSPARLSLSIPTVCVIPFFFFGPGSSIVVDRYLCVVIPAALTRAGQCSRRNFLGLNNIFWLEISF